MAEGKQRVRLVLLSIMCASAYACAHPQAKAALEPPLDVPMPPSRIIQQQNGGVDAPPVGAPSGAPSGDGLPRDTPQPPGGRGAPANATTAAKPAEPPKTDTASAPEAPKPPDEPRAQAPSPLQATTAQREAELETSIRQVLAGAVRDLNRVDYQRLSANGRMQYDSAKAVIRLCNEALQARNLVYAKSLADKARTYADQLR